MSVGTGIFFGLCVIAIVWLYGQTKDRWRWTRIGKWTAIVAAVPFVIGALWFAYKTAQEHLAARPRA